MGRLIDADELTEHIKILGIISEDKNVFTDDIRNAILRRIDAMPTAYDPKRVAARLKALTGEECTLHECGIRSEHCKACIAKKAIEIVKGGGVDGN